MKELDWSLEESEFHCRMASKLMLNLGIICHWNRLLILPWGEMGFIPAFSVDM